MNNYVTSLELSKQLKEAGYKQEGEFWWAETSKGNLLCSRETTDIISTDDLESTYDAPLASELMERLPKELQIKKFEDFYQITFPAIEMNRIAPNDEDALIQDENLCNALAKMWLYLKKEGLLEK